MAKRKSPVRNSAAQQNGTSKAQSIRDAFKELGKKARPKDIIAALAEKRITVSSGQVSTVLRAAGLRRGRRRRKGVATVAAPMHSANGQSSMIDELLKVKKLAKELGGTDKIKELVVALERLL